MHRIREVALQRIIESTAIARINRAIRSVATVPGEALDLKPGDLVDFHRPASSKDASGWHGPAKVIRSTPERGQVLVKWHGREVLCRYPDVHRFIEFHSLVLHATTHKAMCEMCTMIEHLEPRRLLTFGYVQTRGYWVMYGRLRR